MSSVQSSQSVREGEPIADERGQSSPTQLSLDLSDPPVEETPSGRARTEPRHFTIWTDGACLPNPGAGGWGYITHHPCGAVTEACGGETATTNNRMELTAVLEALRPLPAGATVTVYSDSTYVVDGLQSWSKSWARRGWLRKNGTPVPNKDLWSALHSLAGPLNANFVWIRGHSGDSGNERADALAAAGRMSALREEGQ